jgi:hypothetical protein
MNTTPQTLERIMDYQALLNDAMNFVFSDGPIGLAYVIVGIVVIGSIKTAFSFRRANLTGRRVF